MTKYHNDLFRLIRDFLIVYLPNQKAASPNTVKAYKNALNLLIDYTKVTLDIRISEISFNSISRTLVESFLDWLEVERNCSVSSRNHRLSCIRSFYKYVAGRDVTLVAYYQDLGNIPMKKSEKVQEIKFFNESALKTILTQPDTSSRLGIRNRFYMILLYDTAARNQEILDIKLKDIHLANEGSYIVLTGKGRKTRLVPIMDKTVEHYNKYARIYHQTSDGNELLFYIMRNGRKTAMSPDNVEKFIRKYGKEARSQNKEVPEKLHPHMFRHSRSMHLYRGGMPLPLLSEWLGHAQIETSLIYANADTTMKKEALEKATSKLNSLISDEVIINWEDNEEMIKKLYGLV